MVTPYWMPVRGGITTYVGELAAELRKSSSSEVQVLAREGADPGAEILGGTPKGFERRVVGTLQRLAPDVVHAHGHWYALSAAVRYRRRHPGSRVVFTLHTEFDSRGIRRLALRRLLSKADCVTALGPYLLERTAARVGFRSPTEVVPPGTAMRRTPEDRIRAFRDQQGSSGPFLAFLGPLAYARKSEGVLRSIEAMGPIRKSFPRAKLLVAGEGPHRRRLEAAARDRLPEGVAFLGEISDASLFLSAADVYAHVTFQEAFGLAVLEAMACGTPVVASRVGGIPDIVRDGENGLLVSNEPEEIARSVVRILESPDLRTRLTANALQDVQTRYSWRQAAETFQRIYQG